ncbi:MAG: ABC transporter ATP-binding protein [Ruminococcus sp.]|nr:ABC transporter ATP-binding protein [Ruminococcus sp.]
MNDVISTNGLYKNYGNTAVLKDVSISVKQGEIYGLVGKNGAGKTTLMKILLGLVPKTKGTVSLFGADDEKELLLQRRDIGAMIETPSFYPYMTAWDNLNYYRIQRGMKDTECIGRALRLVGLSDTGKKKFREFSLGMKQRLGLALALLHSPKLLILDEPINGLDPEGIVEVRELLENLNKNEGVTILISSHILGELSQLAQRYGFIDKGRLIKEADLAEIESSGGSRTVITVDDTEKAKRLFSERYPSAKYEVKDNDLCIISGYSDEMVSELSAVGVTVKGLKTETESLENYYIKMIGSNKNE